MKKRMHFEAMKLPQLEAELAQLNAIQGKLHREQKTYRSWIEQILRSRTKKEDRTVQSGNANEQLDALTMRLQCEEWNNALDETLQSLEGSTGRKEHELSEFFKVATHRRHWETFNDRSLKRNANEMTKFVSSHFGMAFYQSRAEILRGSRSKEDTEKYNPLFIRAVPQDNNENGTYVVPVFNECSISKRWQAPMLAGELVDATFSCNKIHYPLDAHGNALNGHDRQHQAYVKLRTIFAALGKGATEKLNEALCNVIKELNIHDGQALKAAMEDDSKRASIERIFDAAIDMHPPRSGEEAYLRTWTYFHTLFLSEHIFADTYPSQDRGIPYGYDEYNAFAKNRLSRIPRLIEIDPTNIPAELSHLDPELFSSPGLIIAKEGNSYVFLMREETFLGTMTAKPLALGLTNDPLVTREHLAALLPNEPHDEEAGKEWVSGIIPPQKEVELYTLRNVLIPQLEAISQPNPSDSDDRKAVRKFLQQKQIRAVPANQVLAESTRNLHAIFLTTAEREGYEPAVNVIRCKPIGATQEWEMQILGSAIGNVLGNSQNGLKLETIKITESIFLDFFSNGLYDERIRESRNALHSAPNQLDDMDALLKLEQAANRTITRRWPTIVNEACMRFMTWLEQIRLILSNEDWLRSRIEKIQQDPRIFLQHKMTLRPGKIKDIHDHEIWELLEILNERENVENVTFAHVRNMKYFVCRTEHLPESLRPYVSTDNEETLDLVVNLNLQDEHALETDAWVSGTLPSIEELERELFVQEFVPDKFFPNAKEQKDTSSPESGETSADVSDAEERKKPQPIPRLKALRNTLLKNRWKAHFTVDDRTAAPSVMQYASAEPGHYVLVSLPEAKLQILISDDQSKGTFIIRNLIEPTEFTRISIDEFLAGYGATRVKWDSPEQFRKGLETEIGEQIRDPITIYPIASSYPTPLDSYPNIEAHAALQRDFDLAASTTGKASIDDLTVADFTRIKSGLIRWSFGGVAGGAAYLDRLATEFGLDADVLNKKKTDPNSEGTETDANQVEQYEFRERILRLVLWDLSETYRTERSAMYANKAGHGRWHSLSVRKPRKAATKGVAEPTEPEAAQ